jgi:hypothetical protein
MRSKGFTLRGLRRSSWRNTANYYSSAGGQIIHGDALYLKHDPLNTLTGHKILAAYNQHDLLASFGAQYQQKLSWKTRLASRLLSRWDNRVLRGRLDTTRPLNATDWHDADFF